jgi:excinuclease ABC subunit C
MQEIKKIITSLPHSSGIYQFVNKKWDIIYVGKSKNLKSRVGSYFSGQQKLNFAKQQMISKITDIKYIVTSNEVESLLLENNLIKELQPKYNILLKDDKNFLYIKITKEEYPKIIKTRIAPKSSGVSDGFYFGPYTSWFYVSEIMKILKKIFGYGIGKEHFFKKTAGYNLDKYIFKGNIQKKIKKWLYDSHNALW